MYRIFFALTFLAASLCSAASSNYSSRMASSIISRRQGIMTGQGGASELLQAGIVQKAFSKLVLQHPHHPARHVFEGYIRESVNSVIPFLSDPKNDTKYPLDRLSNGNALLAAAGKTGNSTYRSVLGALKTSIDLQPRNAEGGLWYYLYPNWSYLDGMYSYAPFYTLYSAKLERENVSAVVQEVLFQLDLLWEHCRNASSGLLVHGYDDSKTAVWADPVTGASPHVWGRSLGWYAMALVDTLELLPVEKNSTQWLGLHNRLVSLLFSVAAAADPVTGAWWQVLDRPGAPKNYIESSGSAMFIYALLRSARLGYLSKAGNESESLSIDAARNASLRAYQHVATTFVVNNGNGTIGYNGTVTVCSLNSSASYEYYVGQPILYNSVLGSASFVMASLEVEHLQSRGYHQHSPYS